MVQVYKTKTKTKIKTKTKDYLLFYREMVTRC